MSEFIKIGNTSFRRKDVKGKSLSQLRKNHKSIREDVIKALFDTLEKEATAEKEGKAKAKAEEDAQKAAEKESKKTESNSGSEE